MMMDNHKTSWLLAVLITMSWSVGPASAVHVEDLVRIKGAESSKLTGTGLVVGLPGTGDGKSGTLMRQVTELINLTSDATAVASEMKNVKNVAVVVLSVTIPGSGVREGDKLDVHVSSLLGAKSLVGGRLFLVAMEGPVRGTGVFAFAEGPVTVEGTQSVVTGVVKGGAQMIRDVRSECIKGGKLTLVLKNSVANWVMADELANVINGYMLMDPESSVVARAVDQKNIVIDVPVYEQENPGSFIAAILSSNVNSSMINTGAVVTVNAKTGVIVVGGDVEISPLLLKVEGLTIMTTVRPPADPADPAAPAGAQAGDEAAEPQEQSFLKIDPLNRGGARLSDLMTALNQLKIEPKACIDVIRAINKSGKLHAKLIEE